MKRLKNKRVTLANKTVKPILLINLGYEVSDYEKINPVQAAYNGSGVFKKVVEDYHVLTLDNKDIMGVKLELLLVNEIKQTTVKALNRRVIKSLKTN